MSKIDLVPVTGAHNVSAINDNFDKLEQALNEKVLYRDNPVREPNQMKSDLDMNGKRIYNLPNPVLDHEPATKEYVDSSLVPIDIGRFLRTPDNIQQLPQPSLRQNKILTFNSQGQPEVSFPSEDSALQLRMELDSESGSKIVGFRQPGVNSASTVYDHLIKDRYIEEFSSLADAVLSVKGGQIGMLKTNLPYLTVSDTVDMQGVGIEGRGTIINNTSNLLNVGPLKGCVVRGFPTEGLIVEPDPITVGVHPKVMYRKADNILSFIIARHSGGYISSEHWYDSYTSNPTDTGLASESWRNCVTRFFSEVYVYQGDYTSTVGTWTAPASVPQTAAFPPGTQTSKPLTYISTNTIDGSVSFSVESSSISEEASAGFLSTPGSGGTIEVEVNGVSQGIFSLTSETTKISFLRYRTTQVGANIVTFIKRGAGSLNVIGVNFTTLRDAVRPFNRYTHLAFGDYGRPYIAGNSATDYAFLDYTTNKWFGSVHGGETQRIDPRFYVDGANTELPDVDSFVVGKVVRIVQRTTMATGPSSLNVDKVYDYHGDSSVSLQVYMNGSADVKTAYTAMTPADVSFGFQTHPVYRDVTSTGNNNRQGRYNFFTQADYTQAASTRFLTTQFTLFPMGGPLGANMLSNGAYISDQTAYKKGYYGPVAESRATITNISFATKWLFD